MTHHCRLATLAILLVGFNAPTTLEAEDWPTWRANASRTASIKRGPSAPLAQAWIRRLPKPAPAWPSEQGKIQFDASYEPVAAKGRLFVGSMVTGEVSAFALDSGAKLWTQYCDAAVRFAPVVWRDRVMAVSDDGVLHAWEASSGKQLWKFSGAPRKRWLLGNDRLISMWPARGAPVVHNDLVYFSAGIWPFMGVYVYSINPENGAEVWANTSTGSKYLVQPHNSPAFAGIAPQGYLAADDERLLVSGGRTPPACFDAGDGQFRYFRPNERALGKDAGGFEVILGGADWHVNNGCVYGSADGAPWEKRPIQIVAGKEALAFAKGELEILDSAPQRVTKKTKDRLGAEKKSTKTVWKSKRKVRLNQASSIHMRTGSLVWAEGKVGQVLAFDLNDAKSTLQPVWSFDVDDKIWRMIATDEYLIVATTSGTLHAFASNPNKTAEPRQWPESQTVAKSGAKAAEPPSKFAAPQWLQGPLIADGYAVLLGYDRKLVEHLESAVKGRVVIIASDAKQADVARRQLAADQKLGERIDVVAASEGFQISSYWVDLLICPDAKQAQKLLGGEQVLGSSLDVLRPYGGTLISPSSEAAVNAAAFEDQGYRVTSNEQSLRIRRNGPLPGAAAWTHQNGDAGNSLISRDTRVKGPMGVLWFGGPSHTEVLPRHGHGPTPQVIGGRLFIEGPNMLRAVDVYTGRQMWQRDLPDVGLFYDNTGHHPGAGAIGGNYVSTEDSVYVAYGKKCLRLSPETGATMAEFTLPERDGQTPYWGFLAVHQDFLLAGVEPTAPLSKDRWKGKGPSRFGEGSRALAVLDRKSGKVLWQREAENNFRHNAIVAGGDLLYCLDQLTQKRLELIKRRGMSASQKGRLLALDLATGELRWQSEKNVFGTWLGYSREHDLLLQAGSRNRDRAADEVAKGMTVYRAGDGEVVWSQLDLSYGGPCMLLGDRIITQGAAYELQTGERIVRALALTKGEKPWTYTRTYGCNTAIGCPNLLTFRSAAAGYYDLAADSGTGNWGGFRSSCTSNLIPADGVLNAPDYTRTCVCSYQNQCSLALVHMPDVEVWTFRQEVWDQEAVQQLGINFGAPGDRLDGNGLLWLDYPSVGGGSPDVPIRIKGEAAFPSEHSLRVSDDKEIPNWIRASGLIGASQIRITLDLKKKNRKKYDVRLIMQPRSELAKSIKVAVHGTTKSVSRQNASATAQSVRFANVEVGEALTIELTPASNGSLSDWLICGVQIVRSAGDDASGGP